MQSPFRLRHKAIESLPNLMKLNLKIMPFFMQKAVGERLLNQFFSDAIQDDELYFLEDKVMAILVKDLDYLLNITVQNGRISLLPLTAEANVTLSANHDDLVYMMTRFEDPDTLFFKRKLKIEGETALGLEAKNWLDSMELDILPNWCKTPLMQYAHELKRIEASLPESTAVLTP